MKKTEEGIATVKFPRRRFLHLAAGAAVLPAVSRMARAQAFPTRPITIVVPFAAGGPLDALTRVMADGMRKQLGQPILIENVTGAAGSIGVGRVAHAAPDGYTVGAGNWSTHVANGAVYPLQYDLLKDFDPVALLPRNPMLIVAKKALPIASLTELIGLLKSNPGKLVAGTAGAGSGSHLAGVYFQNITGTRFQFVPYRGTGPAMSDLVAGHIDLMFDQASEALEQVRADAIRAYAVTAKTRLTSAPDIPTVDEAGASGLYISLWSGFWVPKGTPKDIVIKLNAAVADILADTAVRGLLSGRGMDIPSREQQTPEALGAFQRAEIEKWWPIIKAANIKGE